ncbi:MBL fold metallo-hydrolase [Donghicola mangrovi]|uniref:MBL fold metallo-hydrolase n=1 Tax=Donghicola mangrovi TaxID=2729614 RepID=A0A850PYV2_9RHOB|nr:MBL fold metallo-hydrolase [Donghicola mangrovi]NVO21924.1 MBL fold metallo-hydrolase [Donghicola mangrovi]
MTLSRRTFMATAASAGVIAIMPFTANAAAHGANSFETGQGTLTIHPIEHASIVMETPAGVIYVDPVGDAAQYSNFPKPDLILLTHEHGDHFAPETLAALVADKTVLITNPAVYDKLDDMLKAKASSVANGDQTEFNGITIDAIPAHNTTPERANFHPEGRDNGYVLTMGDFRIYLSGDTEVTDAMKGLKDIDLAFVCMNLPFTMGVEQAAEGVAAFAPAVVYPYHYRNKDKTFSDLGKFAELVGDKAEVRMGDWYGGADHA